MGNRTKAYLKSDTATTYLHDPVNELTKVDNTAYECDAAGNLTKASTYSYFWDYENRLTKVKLVSDSSDVAEYTYDALGRRVERIDHTAQSAVTTRFYLDNWSVIEERDGDDTLEAAYVNGPRIDEYLLMVRGGNTYWYCQSPVVGNVAALLDSTGAVKEGYTYRAYGQATVHTSGGEDDTWFTADDPTGTSSALGNPYLFTGREWDEDISLQYNRARWYAPTPGRWTSRDPAGEDGLNLYEYVGSTPISLADPPGLWGGDIHETATTGWAGDAAGYDPVRRCFTVFRPAQPQAIGAADDAIDYGATAPIRDTSWHFRSRGSAAHEQQAFAESLADAMANRCQEAIAHLGNSLHPLQDSFSHSEGHGAATRKAHVRTSFLAGLPFSPVRDPDDAAAWPADVRATGAATNAKLMLFLSVPCNPCVTCR